MAPQPPSLKSSRRNTTVIAAIWVLCLIAILEVIFASIALAPRILTAVRNNQPTHEQVASLNPTSTPAQGIAQTLQSPAQSVPLPSTPSPLNDAVPSDTPQQAPASDSAAPQGASALAIVSAKLDGGEEGARKLLITIKANPKIPIDVPQVKVQVYFYDTDGTEITASKAQVTSVWTSPPVDWKNGEPELLEVRYLPDAADSQIRFAGYVVAIYYKGDLQDYRAEPSRLTKLFPLKYFIGTDE